MNRQFDIDGYVVMEGVLPTMELADMKRVVMDMDGAERIGTNRIISPGADLMGLLSSGTIPQILADSFGFKGRPVRLLLFNKTANQNWFVPWHQDRTIAVRAKHELPGFGPWTEKHGVPHVEPPAGVLDKMVTVRIHFDKAHAANGALEVVPASHKLGRLTRTDIGELVLERKSVTCEVPAGGLLIMKPLLVHRSVKATDPMLRRVLHLEYADAGLPHPLEWA